MSSTKAFSNLARSFLVASALAVSAATSAEAATCFFYNVNIQGNAASNFGTQPFWVTELAVLRDEGFAGNPFEFALLPQKDLNLNGQVGDIQLMTNSAFAANPGIAAARFDLARVAVPDLARFALDQGQSFQLPPPNVFAAPGVGTSSGGLGGLCFLPGAGQDLCRDFGRADVLQLAFLVPRNGGGYFFFPDGMGATIAGEINVEGSQVDNASVRGQYQAIFSGNFAGSSLCD